LPATYIDLNLKPFFWPQLEDQTKIHGQKWNESLSSILDPAEKFVYVSDTRIVPEKASDFVKIIFSSDSVTNATRFFAINENDYREKTGNVSLFVQVSAFNQNHSVYSSLTQSTKA